MNTVVSRIDSQGKVEIPQDLLNRLRLKEGDMVEFSTEGKDLILSLAIPPEDRFDRFVGIAPLPSEAGGSVAWVRSLRDPNDDSLVTDEEGE